MKVDTTVVRDIFFKYSVVYIDPNAGRIHSIKTDNSSLEKAEEFI